MSTLAELGISSLSLGISLTPFDRYQANLSALRTLTDLRSHNPAPRDLETLSHYEGWADGRVRVYGFDSVGTCKPELRGVLESLGITPESLVSAGSLAAYHTPSELATSIWTLALKVLGRAPLAVLEPSAGVGRFLEAAQRSGHSWPTYTRDTNRTLALAVEPDPIFSEILRYRFGLAHPNQLASPWTVRTTTLERSGLVAPTFDLIVGNAPFGDWGVVDSDATPELRHRHLQSRIHDYFLCKCVSLLLPGGVMAMITHASSMDRQERGVREWLSERSELVSMWRFPCDLWEAQGAAPVSDLVVMRKR